MVAGRLCYLVKNCIIIFSFFFGTKEENILLFISQLYFVVLKLKFTMVGFPFLEAVSTGQCDILAENKGHKPEN